MRTLRTHRRKIDLVIDSGVKVLEIYKEQLKQEREAEPLMTKLRRASGLIKTKSPLELKIDLLTNELKHRGII